MTLLNDVVQIPRGAKLCAFGQHVGVLHLPHGTMRGRIAIEGAAELSFYECSGATGQTPHHHLMGLRLANAQALISN
jgi:hypothetical protein